MSFLRQELLVGVDIAPEAIAGQNRETHIADMRELPLADSSK
jgi:hypothetical protein